MLRDDPTPLLTADRLCLTRGGDVIVRDCSIILTAGAGVCLVGPNGAGKSTLLRALAGLLTITDGACACDVPRVYVSPVPLPLVRTLVRDWVSEQCLLSDPSFRRKPESTTNDTMDTGFRRYDDLFGVSAKRDTPLFKLSSGWRQRVKLSRLTPDKTVWLLDEPEDSLDAQGLDVLRALVAAQRAAGGAVIIASHSPDIWFADGFTALQFGGGVS